MPAARWTALCALLLALFVASGCGRPQAALGRWSARLAWGSGVAVGREGDAQVGPLAAAAAPDALVVADSFDRRVLLWTRRGASWQGPAGLAVPAAAPLVAVAVAAAGKVVAADADGGVWQVATDTAAQLVADLRPEPGAFRRVLSLSALSDGSTVAEVLTVTAQRTTREVVRLAPQEPPRPILSAGLAWADLQPDMAADGLMSPTGLRVTLAAAPSGGAWVAVRGQPGRGPEILRVAVTGRIEQRRPLPPTLQRPADFLGVDRAGLGYVLMAAGARGARLVTFDGAGRIRREIALPPGDGPLVPHPAALSPDGALLVMTARTDGLRLDWWPAGRFPVTRTER